MRGMMTNAKKFFMHLKNRVQHVYQNIFLVTDNLDDLITDDDNNFITDESDY